MPIATDPFPNFVPGTLADADQVDARYAALYGVINSLDAANLAAGAVTKAKLATDALNAFLELNTAADRKVAFGTIATPAGFGGSDSAADIVAHGMGVVPTFVFATAGHVGSGSTSSGQNEVVSVSMFAKDATNITFLYQLHGATASVGASYLAWLAIA